jgi:hypothetical protein
MWLTSLNLRFRLFFDQFDSIYKNNYLIYNHFLLALVPTFFILIPPFQTYYLLLSRAAHRRTYSFFTALRAPSFIHIYTKTYHIPLPQLVQAVTPLYNQELL